MSIIPCQRHRFSIPEDIHYLNCGYMSPLSHDVVAAVNAGAQLKAKPWTYRPIDFFSICEEFRGRVARISGAPEDCLAIVPSASYGLAIAARNLPLAKGQQIIVLADQFPSNLYIWRERAAETGASIVTVQRDANAAWTDAVLDAIGPDTAIVAVPHCHWADGRLVDLEHVSKKCRAVGAALVLDLTQSMGAMPIDLSAIRPAFSVTAHYKWMMAPYGTGHLYVDPAYHDGQPIEQNWVNRAGAEDFARLVDYRDDYQPGARRFDMGEKSNPTLLKGAIAGMDFLLEFGVEAIAAALTAKTEAIADQATKLGLDAAPVGVRAPHFLGLGFPMGVPIGLTEKLAAENVFVSQRGQSIRVTPHLYNNERDAAKLVEIMAAALA